MQGRGEGQVGTLSHIVGDEGPPMRGELQLPPSNFLPPAPSFQSDSNAWTEGLPRAPAVFASLAIVVVVLAVAVACFILKHGICYLVKINPPLIMAAGYPETFLSFL